MPFSRFYQVIHYIGVIKDPDTGYRWAVLETGDPKYWLFCLLIGNTSQQAGRNVPVLKSRLPKEIRSMLNNGAGNSI